MEIDLTKILAYSPDCLQNRAQLRSIMMDMYPGKTRDMNLILAVYDSGIPSKIKNDGSITLTQYISYCKKIADDYGLIDKYIKEALNSWIDICLGVGTAATLEKSSSILLGSKQSIGHNPMDTVFPVQSIIADDITDKALEENIAYVQSRIFIRKNQTPDPTVTMKEIVANWTAARKIIKDNDSVLEASMESIEFLEVTNGVLNIGLPKEKIKKKIEENYRFFVWISAAISYVLGKTVGISCTILERKTKRVI